MFLKDRRHGLQVRQISHLPRAPGTHNDSAIHEKSAWHLPNIGLDLARLVTLKDGPKPSPPNGRTHELPEISFSEIERRIKFTLGIMEMIDVFKRQIGQGRRHFFLAHVHKNETPALAGDPFPLLDQLGELLSDKNSAEMPQKNEEQGLRLGLLGQRVAIGQGGVFQRFSQGHDDDVSGGKPAKARPSDYAAYLVL